MNKKAPKYPKIIDSIYTLQKDNRILYLESDYPDWITINVKYEGIFDRFNGKNTVKSIREYIQTNHRNEADLLISQVDSLLQESKIFHHNNVEKALSSTDPKPSIKQAYLTITDDCNLRCTYCYAKTRKKVNHLAKSQWFQIVDSLMTLSFPITFIFTGGEPLLSPYAFELAEYIKSKGGDCILMTNGMLIESNETAKKAAELFNLIKISLDSHDKSIASKLRGEKTYDKVISAIEFLEMAGANYTILSTVTKINKNDLDKFALRFNQKVSFQPLYSMGLATNLQTLHISGDEYYSALTEDGLFKYLVEYKNNIHSFRGNPRKRCSMAWEEDSVSPNGDLYPCHMLHYPELSAGNIIIGDDIAELYNADVMIKIRSINVDNIPKCKECIVRNFCAGACRARLDYTKEGLYGYNDFCNFEKKMILDALMYSYG